MLIKYNTKKTGLCVPFDSHSEFKVFKCGTVNLSSINSTSLNVIIKVMKRFILKIYEMASLLFHI